MTVDAATTFVYVLTMASNLTHSCGQALLPCSLSSAPFQMNVEEREHVPAGITGQRVVARNWYQLADDPEERLLAASPFVVVQEGASCLEYSFTLWATPPH